MEKGGGGGEWKFKNNYHLKFENAKIHIIFHLLFDSESYI